MGANGTAKSFNARSVFSASALVFGSSMVLSVGGFAFHAIASRRLGVADYGALYAIISLYMLAVIPTVLFTPVVTKLAAEFRALHDDAHVRGLIDLIVRAFAVFGAIYVVLGFALAVPLSHFLHVPAWEVSMVGIMCAFGILSAALRAIAQGLHNYTAYGLSMIAEGVLKAVFLLGLVVIGLTVFRGTLAFLLGVAVGAAVVALPLFALYGKTRAAAVKLDWRRVLGTTAAATALTISMTLIGSGDVLVVKHFFDATQAGLYSAASLSAKILLYFVGFVPAILIPQATHRHARGERTRTTLWAAVLFVGIVALFGVIAYRYYGYLVLHALVGTHFDAALGILPTYAGAMALLALTSTLGSYALATHRLAFVIPLLVTTIGTLAVIGFVHPSLVAVADELLAGNACMLGSLGVSLALQSLRRVPA